MDSASATLIGILKDRVDTLRDAGNLHEALHAASAAVEKAELNLNTNLQSIDLFVSTLQTRGSILRQLGQFEDATGDYKQAIDLLQDRPDQYALVGRLYAELGAAYDGMGRPDRAAERWQSAIQYFERTEPPLLLDVAAMSNNLGFLFKAAGDLDTAETYFLRALEISHSQLGQFHEQTATISSNLGALYQAAGYHEQAREMHMIALEARTQLFGDHHPDTAQSHNNFALALLSTGDRTWAGRHFEKSLAAFEALGPEYSQDLEAVATNYCDFLCDEGETQLARIIADRVNLVLEAAEAH